MPLEEPPPLLYKHARVSSQPPSIRSISNNNILASSMKSGSMVRSVSQDTHVGLPDGIFSQPKPSQSESSLDRSIKVKSVRQQTIKEQPSISHEDDLSTDSSLVDEEIKKRKRKLFGFPKKSKAKGD